MPFKILPLVFLLALNSTQADAETVISVPMYKVDETGTTEKIGTITAVSSGYGTVFTPALSGLSPGLHGFHLHSNGDCGPAEKDGKLVPALKAGGHYDPDNTGYHDTPWGDGHRGDLPPLYVASDGSADLPVLAPRVSEQDLRGRALIIHASGDNYSDHPSSLGGGGARVACGVID